jgi:hypothetical protein
MGCAVFIGKVQSVHGDGVVTFGSTGAQASNEGSSETANEGFGQW